MGWFYLSILAFLFLNVNDLSDDKGFGVGGVWGVYCVIGVSGSLTFWLVWTLDIILSNEGILLIYPDLKIIESDWGCDPFWYKN